MVPGTAATEVLEQLLRVGALSDCSDDSESSESSESSENSESSESSESKEACESLVLSAALAVDPGPDEWAPVLDTVHQAIRRLS